MVRIYLMFFFPEDLLLFGGFIFTSQDDGTHIGGFLWHLRTENEPEQV